MNLNKNRNAFSLRAAALALGLFGMIGMASCGAQNGVSNRAPHAAAIPISRGEAVGTWSLVDDENVTFDVVLSQDGSAVSNWSKGPQGAQGEEGRWVIRDGCIDIDYTDGWHDSVSRDAAGRFVKQSYAPGASRSGPPSNFGQAARTPTHLAKWVGLYEVPSAESNGVKNFRIALQSSHVAWKTIGSPTVGCWWIEHQRVCIRWADGWIDELCPDGKAWKSRTWQSGAKQEADGTPVGPPNFEGRGRKVK